MDEPNRNGDTVYGKKGSYSNLRELGAGGMKVVYSATDDQLGNEVVVVFPTTVDPQTNKLQTKGTHAVIRMAMKKELDLLASIASKKQPHSIPRYIDESKNDPYFGVMEKAGEQDLFNKCRQGPLSQSEIINVMKDVLHGLHYLHEKQQPSIIHRDIKPGNIMLKKNGGAVLIDFGTVKHGWDNRQGDAYTMPFKSAGYTCPHQLVKAETPECDLYSLGRVVFYMATGLNLAFKDYYAHKIITGKLSKKLHELPNTHVTKEFSELVDEMCDPDHRGLTATSVFSRLSTLSSSKPILKKPKPLQAAYNVQSAGGAGAQLNVYPPARIILEGRQYTISDHDDGRGNIIPANILIGKIHDGSKCQQQHDGCNKSNKSSPDYEGENIYVGDNNHGRNCDQSCSNPAHFMSRHHLRVFRNGGEVCVINNAEKKLNQRTGVYEETGKSAICRNGIWKPMTHKTKEVLKNHDEVALLWNKDRGAFMSFTFYTQ